MGIEGGEQQGVQGSTDRIEEREHPQSRSLKSPSEWRPGSASISEAQHFRGQEGWNFLQPKVQRNQNYSIRHGGEGKSGDMGYAEAGSHSCHAQIPSSSCRRSKRRWDRTTPLAVARAERGLVLGWKGMGVSKPAAEGRTLEGELNMERTYREEESQTQSTTKEGSQADSNDRGSMKTALESAGSEKAVEVALKNLRENFWAKSTAKVRNSKRTEVIRLAAKLTGSEDRCLPLKKDTIEKVAAMIKVAKLKSGDQYLNELKLWHVEEGFDVPPWMVRLFTLCKKAIGRDKGPVKRAVEWAIEDIPSDQVHVRPDDEKLCSTPAWAYAWACAWMLRCVEACACRWEHVKIDLDRSTVSLTIPKSKMDQMGRGTYRTLSCCGRDPCLWHCVLNIARTLRLKRGSLLEAKGPMWLDGRGQGVGKACMVASWRWMLGSKVGAFGTTFRSHGLCESRDADTGIGVPWAVAIVGGADVCRGGITI